MGMLFGGTDELVRDRMLVLGWATWALLVGTGDQGNYEGSQRSRFQRL